MNYIRFNEFGEIVKRDIRGIVATSDYADIIYIFYDNDINTAESSYQAYARVLRVDGYVVGPAILTLTSIAFDTEEDALLYGTPTYNEITEKYDVPCRTLTLTNEMLAVKGDLGISIIYNQILESGKKITDVNQQIAIKVFEAVEELYTEDEYNELLDLFLPKDLSGLVDTTNFGLTDKFLLRQSGSTKIISGANLILYATADIVSGVQKLKKISLDTVAPAESLNIGETRWNAEVGTLETRLSADVYLQHSQELLFKCGNVSGVDIGNGTAVYISGASGSSPNFYVNKADNINLTKASRMIGLATEGINDSSFGYVCFSGVVNGLNTASYNVGEMLYLSTGGTLTNIRPAGLVVEVGIVIRKHSSSGAIVVSPRYYPRLDDLSNVNFSNNAEGDVAIRTAYGGYANYNLTNKLNLIDVKDLEQDGRLTINESDIDNLEDGTTVIPTYELKANKNVANGYVGLDTNAKIPLIFLYDVIFGQLEWGGSFNPNSGYPTQTNALDPNRDIRKGDYFIANANGTISGVEYNTGDWAIRSASDWQKIDNTDAVASVNGKIGIVNLTGADISVSGADTTTIADKITAIMTALNDRYLKSQVYNKTEIDAIIEQIKSLYDLEVSTLYDGSSSAINVDYANITGTNFVIMEVETEYTLDEGVTFKKQLDTFTITTSTLTASGYNQHFSIYNKYGTTDFYHWFELYNNAGYLDLLNSDGSIDGGIQDVTLKLTAYKLKPLTAENMGYDNSLSGLTADNVQEAIDELENEIDSVEADIDLKIKDIGLDTPVEELNNHTLREVFDNNFYEIELPNGIYDSIENGYKVQRVKKYTLQASDVINTTDRTESVTVGVFKPIDSIFYNNTSYDSYTLNVVGYIPLPIDTSITNANSIGKYAVNNADLTIYISFPLGTTLAEAQTALAGTVIYYQLATPIETEIGGNVTLTKEQMDYWFNIYQTIKEKSTTAYLLDALADIITETNDYQAVKDQVTNIQTYLDTSFEMRKTITPTYEYANWSNSSLSYNTSTFSGWGWGIGAPETIQAFQIQVRTRDIPFTQIKYYFTEVDKFGTIVREGLIDTPNLEANRKYDIRIVLPIPITDNTTQLYFIYETNQLVTAFRSDSQPVGATGMTAYSTDGNFRTPSNMTDIYPLDVFAFAFRAGTALDVLLPTDAFLEGTQLDIKNPPVRIILPNEYVAVVGDTLQIFYRGIIEAVNPYVYDIFFKCSKGSAYTRYWQFTPNALDVGTYTINVTVKTNDGKELANEISTLRVVAKATAPIAPKNVLCFGDSLTAGTGKWVQEFYRRLTGSGGTPSADALTNINFIGTQDGGGGSLHEGYGGWTWNSFLAAPNPTTENFWAYVASHDKDITDQHSIWSDGTNQWSLETIESTRLKFTRVASHTGNIPTGAGSLTHIQNAAHTSNIVYISTQAEGGSPFYDLETNSISFTKYCLRHGFAGIDYVFVLLTWNGLKPHRATAADHAGLITSAKTLIDILHTDYPNAKVQIMGIQLPSLNGGMGANGGASGGYSENYGNVRTVFGLNLAYKAWANETNYSQFIEYINTSGQFDSENNMPESDVPVNIRSTKLEKRGTNGVHPNTDGYYQIGDVAYRHFHKKLQE